MLTSRMTLEIPFANYFHRTPVCSALSDISAKPRIINTYEKTPYNPLTINTYKNARLKVVQNQHLQKNRGGGGIACATGAAAQGGVGDSGKSAIRENGVPRGRMGRARREAPYSALALINWDQ